MPEAASREYDVMLTLCHNQALLNELTHLENNYISKAYLWDCHMIFMCLSDINGLSSQDALSSGSSGERRWAVLNLITWNKTGGMSAGNMPLWGTKAC